MTNASGQYSFGGLAVGTYRVRLVPQSGSTETSPSVGYFDITLTSGLAVSGKDFGVN